MEDKINSTGDLKIHSTASSETSLPISSFSNHNSNNHENHNITVNEVPPQVAFNSNIISQPYIYHMDGMDAQILPASSSWPPTQQRYKLCLAAYNFPLLMDCIIYFFFISVTQILWLLW